MEWLEEIKEDLFDIAHRLREIDLRYKLYRNTKSNRFEVYANGALQVATPFDRLDARTVEFVRSTRLEYANRLIDDIEKSNAELISKQQYIAREKILTEVEKAL